MHFTSMGDSTDVFATTIHIRFDISSYQLT